ncbi:hypothetical protein F511_26615 [Dorcoceras hygrometricum]|uniref:Uncharacterized protein n=1 Tax=Dorcoceras hygrometricum TaxID=472368 RepID=A0A2Z7BVH0_9LAMI|nr:hypothetical protein F511_26615 [Dorcoceras hygrometricum]
MSFSGCDGERQYRTLISLLGSLATMHRVVNYHSSWARQRQILELCLSSLAPLLVELPVVIRCLMHSICILSYWGLTQCPSGAWFVSLFVLFLGNQGFTAGRGFNPSGGARGGG